jgi:hypothetical protein
MRLAERAAAERVRLAVASDMCSDRAVLFPELILVHDPEPHPAALNMALDEVLLTRCEAPSFGLSVGPRPLYLLDTLARCRELSLRLERRELVRRWTGGGVVPHGEDLTYTLGGASGGSFFALCGARLRTGSSTSSSQGLFIRGGGSAAFHDSDC